MIKLLNYSQNVILNPDLFRDEESNGFNGEILRSSRCAGLPQNDNAVCFYSNLPKLL